MATDEAQSRLPLTSRDEAEGYVAMICFKHGPPTLVGVELEWTLHHPRHPDNPVDLAALTDALGDHAPRTLRPSSPHLQLAHGSRITVEPGGQVEISSLPATTAGSVRQAVDDDVAALDSLLAGADLVRGGSALDAHRPPRRLLELPRYAAMQAFFDTLGPQGSAMMCSTAGLQVCLDAGERADVPARWRVLHAIGPAMVALFANSARDADGETGWRSARLRSTLGTCPPVTHPPVADDVHPAEHWATLAMSAPVLCVRREGDCWDAPAGLTFGEWVAGVDSLPAPTYDDLDYHLSTLFPPVRPRGYLEVRYLDTQPDDRWHHPVLLLDALLSTPATVDAALDATQRSADRWLVAAERGLDDEPVLESASALVALGCEAMTRRGVDQATTADVAGALERRIADHAMRRHTA